ncbi:MAG: hypothetical protein LBV58_00835 [Acholeplasmatales bacterium]|jgi:UDPglucose--hexose-1-phosphate uridylyltransferase|nr:hypothetical protein [Acholeplasmatales bacterium]
MIYKYINSLIDYEIRKNIILERDYIYIKNQLFELLRIEPKDSIDSFEINYLNLALDYILKYCDDNKTLDFYDISREKLTDRIMNVFSSKPSTIEDNFYKIYKKNKNKAIKYFYNYCVDTYYVKKDRIEKNLVLKSNKNNNIIVTINLSKPEKDPNEIIKAANLSQNNYPLCSLCKENEGFSGDAKKDSRDNLRMIEFKINDSSFYFQYSPYGYFNEHCIVLSKAHKNMEINDSCFFNLLELVDIFPHYFFGSNADLPIVGGSILSHDHYQGGRFSFPIEKTKIIKSFNVEDIIISIIDWPLSTIRLTSKNKNSIKKYSSLFLNYWINYDQNGIIPFENGVRHNTITPICRKKKENYEMDLVLRNNQTSSSHPLGIYHFHEEIWHIKKENIGLIEVMGLAILPPRLVKEIEEIKKFIKENNKYLPEDILKHEDWINDIKLNNPLNLDKYIEEDISKIFKKGLNQCKVLNENNIEQLIKGVLNE